MAIRRRSPWNRPIGQGLEQLETRVALASLPGGFAEITLAAGIDRPTAMAIAPDGRVFVAEQTGALRIVKNGHLLAAPFTSLPVDSQGERGLLGVAFDPNFASNKFVYVYYTTSSSPVHNRVSRFTANGDVAVAGSEVPILELDNLTSATNHNGGAIHFGLDGKLYIAVGENATASNSQDLANLHGKILRINSNGSIPIDNPFVNTPGARDEIWALGLRNPFTFSVQPGTGRMFVNDVGGSQFEEINDLVKGGNYGWPSTEGEHNNPNFINPLLAYARDTGQPQGRAITGGAFYNPANTVFPASYVGDYFFSDIAGGWIWKYDVATDTATEFATGIAAPVDLQVSPEGDLYYLERGQFQNQGVVRSIRFTNGAPLVEIFGGRSYRESDFPAPIAPTAAVADPNSPNFARGRLTVSISENAEAADRLGIRSGGAVTTQGNVVRVGGVAVGTFSGGAGAGPLFIDLNGFANASRTRTLLRNIVFSSTSTNPSAALRTIRVHLREFNGNLSTPEFNTMRVIPVGGAATSESSISSIGYRQNAAPVPLFVNESISDATSDSLANQRLLVRITRGADASNRLAFGDPVTLAGDNVLLGRRTIGLLTSDGIGQRDLAVTFTSAATTGDAQQLLRSLRFRTVQGTSLAPREVEVWLEGVQKSFGKTIRIL